MSRVILDDRDKAIKYSANWGQAGTAPDWHQSSMQPDGPGSTFNLTFSGTAVQVLGVLHKVGPGDTPAVSSFSLDGAPETNYTEPINVAHDLFHQPFFNATGLPDTEHTLSFTHRNEGVLFIDSIIYTASPSFTPLQDTNFIFDDSDSALQFSDGWESITSDQTMNGAIRKSAKSGSTMNLTFKGAAIALYGRLDSITAANSPTQISWTIDDGKPIKATYPAPSTGSSNGDQLFLRNNMDPSASHKLTLKMENDQPFYVDHIAVAPLTSIGTKSDTFSAAQAKAGGITSSGPATPTAGGGKGAGGSATPTSTASPSSPSNAGAIAGGVVGGLAVIGVLILAFLLLRRRQRRTDRGQEGYRDKGIVPFPQDTYPLSASTASQGTYSYPSQPHTNTTPHIQSFPQHIPGTGTSSSERSYYDLQMPPMQEPPPYQAGGGGPSPPVSPQAPLRANRKM